MHYDNVGEAVAFEGRKKPHAMKQVAKCRTVHACPACLLAGARVTQAAIACPDRTHERVGREAAVTLTLVASDSTAVRYSGNGARMQVYGGFSGRL